MSIACIEANWSGPANIRAMTTTRGGGVSAKPYDSLNLGLHVGDDLDAVMENRRRIESQLTLPSSPRWLKQSHGVAIADLDQPAELHTVIEADGAWTATAGVVVAVLTADCLPVVICNASGTQLAVVHAGWRGLAAGILDSAIARFDPKTRLHAWLGPAIGPDAFEVGEEVRQAFIDQDAHNASAFVKNAAPDKWLADLYSLASRALSQLGDVSVSGGQHCTVSESTHFHSHRRDGVRSGRMATLAWIE